MQDTKNTDADRGKVSPKRRDLLKTGVALAVAPLLAGAAVLPARVRGAARRVLAISASPRAEGNSDILCDEFLRGATAAGHAVEKIRLAEKNIGYCTGCLSCISSPGACVQQDDMGPILEKMLAADILVLASPVYFLSFNGQMKTFLDRLCPIYTMLDDRDVYFVASAAGGQRSIDSIVQGFRIFTACLHGAREMGTVAITGVWDEGRARGSSAFRQAYEMGLGS